MENLIHKLKVYTIIMIMPCLNKFAAMRRDSKSITSSAVSKMHARHLIQTKIKLPASQQPIHAGIIIAPREKIFRFVERNDANS